MKRQKVLQARHGKGSKQDNKPFRTKTKEHRAQVKI